MRTKSAQKTITRDPKWLGPAIPPGEILLEESLTHTQESAILTHRSHTMRTNIEIDDRLMRQAMRRGGARTKRATVEKALRLLIQTEGQGSIRRLRGKVDWQGDLNASRLGRVAK